MDGSQQDGTDSPQRLGGLARARALSPSERREIARKAAKARWAAHEAAGIPIKRRAVPKPEIPDDGW